MVYDRFEIENYDLVKAQNVSLPDPKVVIEFNGTGIHTIAGPTPLIELSSSYNRSAVGQLESIERKISLVGQIVRSSNRSFTQNLIPEGSGVSGLIGAYEKLKEVFQSCSAGTLSIYCDNTLFFEKHNVKVNSISFDSNDNFIQVGNYNVDLSFVETGVLGFAVKNTIDEWSIEPLEDYTYVNYQIDVDKNPEYHNPNLDTNIPATIQQPNTEKKLNIIDVPRYKISRKLSAVGLPSTGTPGCTDAGVNASYLEAKKWVESRLPVAFENSLNKDSIKNSGISAFTENPLYPSFGADGAKTYLYNHVRTINYSINDGIYAVNESWLAMPTGIRYIEDYSLDVSTDENYIKTVSVKGEIKGLYAKTFDVMIAENSSGLPPNDKNLVSLDYDTLEDAVLNTKTLTNNKSNNLISQNRYENAMSGFMYDIKPILYTRASMGLNNAYHSDYWLDTTTSIISSGNPFQRAISSSFAPQVRNPTYSKERVLNIIPISTSESHNIKTGSISYSYDYNNKANLATGVLSSNLTVDTTFPNDIYAESFVLGRSLGPVLQDLGTISSAQKNISIEVSVIPPLDINGYHMTSQDCPMYTGGYIYTTITGIIESLKPYGDRTSYLGYKNTRTNDRGKVFLDSKQENWNPLEGKYSLSVSYKYQPCDSSRGFRDI